MTRIVGFCRFCKRTFEIRQLIAETGMRDYRGRQAYTCLGCQHKTEGVPGGNGNGGGA